MRKTKPKNNKNKKRNKEGLGPNHLTWPLNPPKKNRKNKENKKWKKEAPPKTAKMPKNNFSVIGQIFLFWVAFQNFPFLTPWPKKRWPPKRYKNRGFRPFFGKQICVTKRPFLDQKTKIHKFQLSFFLPIFFSFNNTKPKFAETPVFIVF